MFKKNCDICGGAKSEELFSEKFSQKNYYYAVCETCSHVSQFQRYSYKHYEKLPCQTQDDYEAHTIRRGDYIFEFIKDHITIKKDFKILDIGCGEGGVMKRLKELIPNSHVVGYTLESGKQKIDKDLTIIYKNIETDKQPIDPNKYDLIIMSHVVEHLYYPIKTMKNIGNNLKENGILYVEVPSFFKGEVRIPKIFSPEHLSFFTSNSISNLLTKSDFKILKLKDSIYWGNIKVISKKSKDDQSTYPLDYMSNNEFYLKRFFYMISHPFIKLVKKFKKVKPNE